MAVMADAQIHPELRRVARFVPRRMVHPWSLSLVRRLRMTGASDGGVEVLTLPTVHGVRPYRPAGPTATAPAMGSRQYFDSACVALSDAVGFVRN